MATSRRTRRFLRRIRPLLVVVLGLSVVLLVAGAVVAAQAWLAKGDLEKARASVDAARSAVKDGRVVEARRHLGAGRTQASRAHGRLTSWLWSGYGKLPVFGSAVRETRGLVEATDSVLNDVLPPLVDSAPDPAGWTGTANLPALRRAAAPLKTADAKINVIRVDLRRLPLSKVRVLDDARAELIEAVDALAVDVREAQVGAAVLPDLLGDQRPTRLLIVAQNLAEERATGGLIGAFALVRADQGRLTLERSGSDDELRDAASAVVSLGQDFDARYGAAQATRTWRSANLTPDVPSAGAILAALSSRQLGKPVDAVVMVDPVALSHVLRATGPVRVPGIGDISAANASSLLMKDIYVRYPTIKDQPVRKAALRRALAAVVNRLQRPARGSLVPELARAAATGHAQLYAVDERLESELRRARIGGALPNRGPYLSLVTQDVGGSKLGYYLKRDVSYEAAPSDTAIDLGQGPETVEEAVVTVRLTNTAPPSGLPPYVTYRADDPTTRPRGQLRTWVSIYLGPRSTYASATLNGKRVALSSQVEAGLSVFSAYVSLDPGRSAVLQIQVQQPAAPGSALVWRQQPRLQPDGLVVERPGRGEPVVHVYSAS